MGWLYSNTVFSRECEVGREKRVQKWARRIYHVFVLVGYENTGLRDRGSKGFQPQSHEEMPTVDSISEQGCVLQGG